MKPTPRTLLALFVSFVLLFTCTYDLFTSSSSRSIRADKPLLIDIENPCGVTSVAVAVTALGSYIELSRVRKFVRCDSSGATSMADILDGVKHLGYKAIGASLSKPCFRVLDAPLILYIEPSHFATVIPTGTDTVVLVDPPMGVSSHAIDSLVRTWPAKVILVCQNDAQLQQQLGKLVVK